MKIKYLSLLILMMTMCSCIEICRHQQEPLKLEHIGEDMIYKEKEVTLEKDPFVSSLMKYIPPT